MYTDETPTLKELEEMVISGEWVAPLNFKKRGGKPQVHDAWSQGFDVLLRGKTHGSGLNHAGNCGGWRQIIALAGYDDVSQDILKEGLVCEDDKVRAIAWDKLHLHGDQGIPDEIYHTGFQDPLDCVRGAAIATYTHMAWKKLPEKVMAQGLGDKNRRIRGVCLEEWVARKKWTSLEELRVWEKTQSAHEKTYIHFGLARSSTFIQQDEWVNWLWRNADKSNRSEIRNYILMNSGLNFTPRFLKENFRLPHLLAKKSNPYIDMWVTHRNFNPTAEEVERLVNFNEHEPYPRSHWEHIFLTKKIQAKAPENERPRAL